MVCNCEEILRTQVPPPTFSTLFAITSAPEGFLFPPLSPTSVFSKKRRGGGWKSDTEKGSKKDPLLFMVQAQQVFVGYSFFITLFSDIVKH